MVIGVGRASEIRWMMKERGWRISVFLYLSFFYDYKRQNLDVRRVFEWIAMVEHQEERRSLILISNFPYYSNYFDSNRYNILSLDSSYNQNNYIDRMVLLLDWLPRQEHYFCFVSKISDIKLYFHTFST